MFSLRLKLKKQKDNSLIYGIPLVYRFILAGIGLIILLAIGFSSRGVRSFFIPGNIVPLLFVLSSFLAASYLEQWTMDKKAGRISYKTGLLFLYKTKTYRLSDVKAVELVQYRKGGTKSVLHKLPGQQMGILSLLLQNGEKINMETQSSLKGSTMYTTGKMIAEYCGVPFINNDTI